MVSSFLSFEIDLCTFRLARYNVQAWRHMCSKAKSKSIRKFVGLPIPVSECLITVLSTSHLRDCLPWTERAACTQPCDGVGRVLTPNESEHVALLELLIFSTRNLYTFDRD